MHLLRRRDIVRGLGLGAGAALFGALGNKLVAEARGVQAPPCRRLIVFTNGNGFTIPMYERQATDPVSFDMGGVYTPLEPYRDQLLILERFYNPHDRALHGNQWATLSMRPSPDQTAEELRGPPGGISIDRLIATEGPIQSPISSLAVGIEEGPNKVLCTSADGPEQPYPAYGSPVQAFDAYMSGLGNGAVDVDQLVARDGRLLDHVRADSAKLRAALAGPERAKLEQYEESLHGLEAQLAALHEHAAECAQITGPSDDLDRANLDPAIVQAHGDVVFAALQCGLSHVAHISILGFEGPHNAYSWLGDQVGHHNNHHDNNLTIIEAIDTFVLSQVAAMMDRLSSVPEDDGTMADHSLVMYVNTCGGSHHNGQDTHAVLLLGGGGQLETGRYLKYEQGEHSMADVFVSVARAMGLEIETFGTPEHCKGPLPGLI